MIVPFIWMVTTSIKSPSEVNKGNVGFIPFEEHSVYDDGTNEFRIKIVKAEIDSSYVNVINSEGKIISSFKKISNSAIHQ